jgi:hypothetical protein
LAVSFGFVFEATCHLRGHFNAGEIGGMVGDLLFCLFATDSLKAQTPDPLPTDPPQPEVRPPLCPFPRYEDWSFLRDPAKRVDPYDRLKFIPLNALETIYVTLKSFFIDVQ